MPIDRLLARPGLDPGVRLLAVALIAIWRGDWPRLVEAAKTGASRRVPRADFEEMLLQAVLFCGFPRAVSAFEKFVAAWPATEPPTGGSLPSEQQAAAGRELFDAIYGKNAETVHDMLGSFHADFRGFVLEVAYGRILARPRLSGRVRELLAVAALAASNQRRQFAGHARGALHLGATRDEVREVLATVFEAESFEAESEVTAWLNRVPEPD